MYSLALDLLGRISQVRSKWLINYGLLVGPLVMLLLRHLATFGSASCHHPNASALSQRDG